MPLTAPPKAAHDPFKSGWDDTLKSAESLKKQTSFKPKGRVTPLRIPPPALRLPSPTYSDSSAEEENDASFAASTQNYLLSPTAKEALGRVGMVILSPMSQSAVDLDDHAESQQLIQKPVVSQVEALKVDKHLRPPSHGVPTTPTTISTFGALTHPPVPTRPARQDSLSIEVRPQPPIEPPVDRAARPSKSRGNLSVSVWPSPPTAIPLSPATSLTRSPSRSGLTPSPTFSPSPNGTGTGGNRDSLYDYVRQPSPTIQKMTITNRDRAYIFGAPPVPTVTPAPRVSPPFQGPGIVQIDTVPELKEVPRSKSPVLVPAKSSLKRWGSRSSQVSWTSMTGGNGNAISPSMNSFIDSPSIYSTYSGNQPHAAGTVYMSVVKETTA